MFSVSYETQKGVEMASTQQIVSQTIRAQIALTGKTHQSLANALGFRREALYRRLKGIKPWDTDELDEVAKFFGLKDAYSLIDLARKNSQQFSDQVRAA
jgi:hypothetical protein